MHNPEEYTIKLAHIECLCIIGILPHERTTPQTIWVDIDMRYTYAMGKYIDYREVVQYVRSTLEVGQFELLEEAVHSLLCGLPNVFSACMQAHICIHKPQAIA